MSSCLARLAQAYFAVASCQPLLALVGHIGLLVRLPRDWVTRNLVAFVSCKSALAVLPARHRRLATAT